MMQSAGAMPIRDGRKRAAVLTGRAGRMFLGMLQFPYLFVAMNWAAVVGLYAFLRKRKDVWVRPADAERWEGVVEPMASLPQIRPADSMRKAA
jgi:hypothetical protein